MTPTSIWDLPERGTRGPKPRYDRAAIAAAAVRIADEAGLEALTMQRVASVLGIATMSLYNYVATKDQLAQLMVDQLAGEYLYPSAASPDSGRRSAIVDLARQARDIARRHPWLPRLLLSPLPPGPNGLRYLDYFLGLLAGTDLDTGQKMEIIALISGFATMYGGTQAALAKAGTSTGDQVDSFVRAAAGGGYPNLAAALAVAGPVREDDAVFESCVLRLAEVAV